jgi:Carboxypeptidase regulatory-like domain
MPLNCDNLIQFARFEPDRRRLVNRLIALFLFCLLLASMLGAQGNRASISGQVTDPSGAAVRGAKIIVTSVERGTAPEASTNDTGRYQIGFLDPGTYIVTVEAPGFKKSVQMDARVAAPSASPPRAVETKFTASRTNHIAAATAPPTVGRGTAWEFPLRAATAMRSARSYPDPFGL